MKKKWIYFIIIGISLFSIFPLLVKSNVWGHDTNFHLANIEDVSRSIDWDNLFPKISTNIGYGYGYGTHLFYAPLPHYFGGYLNLIFQIFHLRVDSCLVFIYFLISFLSGLIMYELAHSITKNPYLSLLSSIIYLLFPYRMGDIIVRSAYNEVFTFLFIPMIFLSLQRFLEGKKFTFLFVVGYVGLIYSHLVMALYTSLFLIPWVLLYYKEVFSKGNIQKLIKAVLLVTIFVLPFLSLILAQKLNGEYMVFVKDYLSGLIYVETFANTFKDFLVPLTDYSWDVPYYIHLLVIIGFLASTFFFFQKKKKEKNFVFYLILLTISFFMCLKGFPWKILPDSFYMIQFAWRLQTFLAIALSILAPLCLSNLQKDTFKKASFMVMITLVVTTIPLLRSMMYYPYLLDENIDPNYGMGHSSEYLPVNSFKNQDYFKNQKIEVLGETTIGTILKNTSKKFIFKIENETPEEIEIPRFYYSGYVLKNSQNQKIKIVENEHGMIEFIGNSDTYTLTYEGPFLYQVFTSFSILTLIGLGGYQIIKYQKKKKH